jgi:hypothetical protein
MDALNAALRSIDVQSLMLEIDLQPSELTEFLRSQAMPIGYQDRPASLGPLRRLRRAVSTSLSTSPSVKYLRGR